MNNKLYILGAFVGGAAIGVASSWFLLKTKYERYAQEEIDSVKETYAKKAEDFEEEDFEEEIEQIAKEKVDEIIEKEGYMKYTNVPVEKKSEPVEKEVDDVERPYVISPEEFDEIGYNLVSLTYYADKKLVDDLKEVEIENVDEIIGLDNLNTFGQYEDDSVFVRNDKTKTDYEILLDTRTWAELRTNGE